MVRMPPRSVLYSRIRPLCGFGPDADQVADAICRLFSVVELRDQDLDITSLGASRRQLLRQRWLVAAFADGPTHQVEGDELGLLDSFGRPA